MHNGGIAEFTKLKRRLQQDLPDFAFDMVQGNTGTILGFMVSVTMTLIIIQTQSGVLRCSCLK